MRTAIMLAAITIAKALPNYEVPNNANFLSIVLTVFLLADIAEYINKWKH